MVAAGKAPSAWACTTTSHCYALGQANGPDNYGQWADINISCLYINNDSDNFVTNELWDQSGNDEYWEEDGAISGSLGANSGGNYYNRELFWADSRPNGGSFHFHPVATTGDQTWTVEMEYVGDDTWDLYSGNSWEVSTGQPLYSDSAHTTAGTEYTVNSGVDSMRDVGSVSSIEWEDSSGNWHLEGGSMGSGTAGPGPWISPSYSSSSSTVSWAGPC